MLFEPGDLIKYKNEDAWYFVSEVKEGKSNSLPFWVAVTVNLKDGEIQDIEFETAEKYFGCFAGDLYRNGERIYAFH